MGNNTGIKAIEHLKTCDSSSETIDDSLTPDRREMRQLRMLGNILVQTTTP
ncbi:hypothetical protein J6590_102375 [Homalodisca vitripennis]|nr:hypothetical protein J6590_102375 [Homalodisca vitripennis]